MSDLANQTPASTYKGLLQVNDYTNGVDGTSKFVQDGEGTDSVLSLSTTKVGIGTDSPNTKLSVFSASAASSVMRVARSTSPANQSSYLFNITSYLEKGFLFYFF